MILFIVGIIIGAVIGSIITKYKNKNKEVAIIGYIDGYATKLYEFNSNFSKEDKDRYKYYEKLYSYIEGKFPTFMLKCGINIDNYDLIIASTDYGVLELHNKEK